MRVAHLCKTFSKLSETFIYDYVTELQRQGVNNHVIANRRLNVEERPFEPVTELSWPSLWNPRRLFSRFLEVLDLEDVEASWRMQWPGLVSEIERLQPDVLHAHFGRPGVKAVPVAERFGVPLVVTFYGYDISELPRQPRWRQAYERIWQTAGAVLVLSEEMKERAVHWGAPAEKIHVVHLVRDLESFSFSPPEPPMTEFVTVGRLTEKKGHLDAIRAVQRVLERGDHLQLKIVGEGPMQEELTQYIQAHDLQGYVTLLGRRSNEEVAQILKKADAFLLCSKTASSGDREGTPTVLIEAQAVGLPCVSTTHAGIPEMIPESNHRFLAEEGDVEGISECIRTLSSCSVEEVRDIAEAGRKKVEQEFHLSREVEKLRGIYERIGPAPIEASSHS